jgi:murein L,D-transpeptidase YafK
LILLVFSPRTFFFPLIITLVLFLFSPYSEAAADTGSAGGQLPSDRTLILIKKSTQTLSIIQNGKPIHSYPCSFGVNPNGDKEQLGDNKTPEGHFYVTDKSTLDNHPYLGKKWLGISYPDIAHAETGLKQALIDMYQYQSILRANERGSMPPQNTALGGWIGIHGGRDELTKTGVNWTEGCIALLEKDLDELYSLIDTGTEIIITR